MYVPKIAGYAGGPRFIPEKTGFPFVHEPNRLFQYETGENDVPTHVLLRLAELYGTSTDYLLGRTDVREPYPPSKRRDP